MFVAIYLTKFFAFEHASELAPYLLVNMRPHHFFELRISVLGTLYRT
jgi:hypothetical protein